MQVEKWTTLEAVARGKKSSYDVKPPTAPVNSHEQPAPVKMMTTTVRFGGVNAKVPVPNVASRKQSEFIKGVKWAEKNLAKEPTKEIANLEKNAKANISKLRGGDPRLLKIAGSIMGVSNWVRHPVDLVGDNMIRIALRKAGLSRAGGVTNRLLDVSPFWFGVAWAGIALQMTLPNQKRDAYIMQRGAELLKKYAGIDIDMATGLPILEQTNHDEKGKFTSAHKAKTITKGGVRYKPVVQLRKLKGVKTRSKEAVPPQEEAKVVNAIDHARDEAILKRWRFLASLDRKNLSEV